MGQRAARVELARQQLASLAGREIGVARPVVAEQVEQLSDRAVEHLRVLANVEGGQL